MDLDNVINPDILKAVPQQPQVQCDTQSQLEALIAVANRFGLYDAADVIRKVLS